MVILFTVTIFLGAALLFLAQPMFARMILPLLGGSPSVWNTAMMFYQAALLAGYAYAHAATRRLGVRRQVLVHGAVMLAPLLVLPIAAPRGWQPPTQGNPVPWLLALMTVSVGLPFFVVSTTSPLLQRWFASSGHRRASDPYFLYAASNLGSLLALFCYPVFIEPRLRLAEQSRWWTMGFVALVVLVAVCGWWTRRAAAAASTVEAKPETVDVPVCRGRRLVGLGLFRRRLYWAVLAFVPCSLMLSVTSYITNAIAPVPMLWMIPLGVYLLTFVLVFARRRWLSHKWMVRLLPLTVLAMAWAVVGLLQGQPMEPLDWNILLHVVALFIVAMVCHGELANDRPPAGQLTEFYLWMSLGGVLGGMFNALLAPLLFPTVWEYPVTLVLACLLAPRRTRLGYVVGSVLVGVAAVGLIVFLQQRSGTAKWRTVYRARSFFGVHQVFADPSERFHFLKHGCTVHGVQNQAASQRREPLTYFGRSGPLGELMAALPVELKRQVGVVGLGAGTVACYGERGQQWTFYEIDPVVERIARDPRCFTFLADCPAEVKVVLGDARLSLEREPDGRFGLLILDPYNSDTPPLHLLTREALALYLRKTAPDGVLAFHVSTSHLDLKSVLANLASDANVFSLHLLDFANASRRVPGQTPSRWLVMSRRRETLRPLANLGYWNAPRPQAAVGVWTDDYAGLFRVWSWR